MRKKVLGLSSKGGGVALFHLERVEILHQPKRGGGVRRVLSFFIFRVKPVGKLGLGSAVVKGGGVELLIDDCVRRNCGIRVEVSTRCNILYSLCY